MLLDTTGLVGLACPSASECVALDDNKAVARFNPSTPGTPVFHPLGGGADERGLGCASASLCVATETTGNVQLFNPAAPGTPPEIELDAAHDDLHGVACPSATQCTVVGDNGVVATFDPAKPPAAPIAVKLDGSHSLFGIACPTTTICVAGDNAGQSLELNPAAPAGAVIERRTGVLALGAVACPSASQCTIVDQSGRAVTGVAPTGGGGPTPAPRLTVTRVRVRRSTTKITLRCQGARGQCAGRAYTTVLETRSGKRLLGVRPHATTARRRVTVTLGSHRFQLAAGHRSMVPVTLNRAGHVLLKHRARLRVTLHVKATVSGKSHRVKTKTITLTRRRRKRRR